VLRVKTVLNWPVRRDLVELLLSCDEVHLGHGLVLLLRGLEWVLDELRHHHWLALARMEHLAAHREVLVLVAMGRRWQVALLARL
jgi:hypothetical protein